MWNAIQGVANKASKLAVEVLDPGTTEQSKPSARQTPSTSGTITTDRLSALKARYKASESDGVTPVLDGDSIESVSTDSRFTSGILNDSSEVMKLRTQLEKLKQEMMRQNTVADDQLKQQRFHLNEQMKQLETEHRSQLDHSREEITKYFQSMLESKEQEIIQLKSHGHPAAEDDVQFQQQLQLLNSENAQLKSEIAELQKNEIHSAFGLDLTPSQNDDLTQLQDSYEKLKQDYNKLEQYSAQLISPETLTERDAFWQKELERVRSETRGVKEDEVTSLQDTLYKEQKAKEAAIQQQSKLEEEISRLQHSLEERDSIWQQELIASQNTQLEIKKNYEAIKVELSEISEQKEELERSVEKLKTDFENEVELRMAAESHVKSLQKSLIDLDSGASGLRQQLADSMSNLEQIQNQHESKLQSLEQNYQQRLKDHEAGHQHLTQINQDLISKLEKSETEHQRVKTELESVKTRYLADGEELDLTQMSYDLESATENLKLARTRNSLLTHELESLNKELEDIKQTQSIVESTKTESMDPELIQKLQNERDSFKEQLKRLKQQLIQMEEDQEASIHWRIDAEVKLALEAYKQQQENFPNKTELESALEQERKISEDFRIQCETKTQEISNLQIALGELTYHGEAADKLRRDLRAAQDQIQNLNDQLMDRQASIAESNSARRAAEAAADEAHQQITNSEQKIRNLETSLFTTKKELLEVSQKLQQMGNDASSSVDRRLVVQLLVAYLEKRHSKDALEVMARMLGFTEEEKNRIGVKSTTRGFLGSVAGGTLALVKGGMSVATLGLLDRGLNSKAGSQLADEWVEFLTKDEDLKTPQEQDPLAYLQQGLDSPKRQSMPQSPHQYYSRTSHSPSLSSRSEVANVSTNAVGIGSESRVQNWRNTTTGGNSTVSTLQPFSGSIPSFKDYIEQQNAS
eukprot:g6567.t1